MFLAKKRNLSIQTFLSSGNTIYRKEAKYMDVKGLAIAMGVGAAVGAVAILAMPKNNPTRKLAAKAADKVEDVAWRVSNKFCDEMDL
jgi:hypothetical protein